MRCTFHDKLSKRFTCFIIWGNFKCARRSIPQQCFAFNYRIFAYLEIDDDDVYKVLQECADTAIKKKWDAKVLPWLKDVASEDTNLQFLELEKIFYSP